MTAALLADLRALAEEGTDPSGEPLPEWVHVDDLRDLIAKHETQPDASERDELAQVIDAADNRWQHGIGSGGYDISGPPLGIPIEALADAILAAGWRRT